MTQDQKLLPETRSALKGHEVSFFYPDIIQKSFEKLVELQRSAFDVYEQQARAAIQTAKELFPVMSLPSFEIAEQEMNELLRMQKRTLELVLDQSTAYMNSMRTNPFVTDGREIKGAMHDSAEYLVSMQKKAVDFATQQTQRFTELMRQEPGTFGTTGMGAADAIQRGTDAFVRAQNRFWEIMLKPYENTRIEAQG